MAFVFNDFIIDHVDSIKIDGIEIANSSNSYLSMEITADTKDVVNNSGDVIRRCWIAKHYVIITENKNILVTINDGGENHLLCIIGKCFRNKPNKNQRIAKKWKKQYGKQYYGHCCINMNFQGNISIEQLS